MQATTECAELFTNQLSLGDRNSEAEASAAMMAAGRETRWRRNEACDALVTQGSVACVLSGAIRKFALRPNGQRQIIDLFVVGDYLGYSPADPIFLLEAISNDTRVVAFKREQIDELAIRFPAVASLMQRRAADAIRRLEHHLLAQSRMTAREKVGAYLAEMSRRVNRGGTKTLVLPITRYDIADHLGIAAETVSRTITVLRRRGSITLKTPRDVEICDPSLLPDAGPRERVRAVSRGADP